MWQSSHTRHTQRSARRRNHLGLLACLMAALFTGVLLGRMSGDPVPTGHIYLNEATPAPTPKAAAPAQKRAAQPMAEAVPRQTTTAAAPRARHRQVRPTPSPTDQVPGYTADEPVQVLRDSEPVQSVPGMASEVVRLTNTARARQGCGPLRADARLTRAAREHSYEMARSGQFTHESPDGSSPWDRMERAGYPAGAAENIGRGYSSAEEAVSGWLDSPDHRRNILSCDFKAIGVGVVSSPEGIWWTQDFGRS
ncbi:CAP domain-containing protein [Nonomuraea ceibae]|uniref:CAP domain-containing protein n=1 Tax=Nonomuraea ceibae TaxID=1935170 RepID=UPI001C5E9929|nr:CAP domain-containing protein [Nonomuraea ceibae]